MLPDRISNPGPLTYESGALLIALRGPARRAEYLYQPAHPHRPKSVISNQHSHTLLSFSLSLS